MSFTVTASTPSREVSFSASSMLAALKKVLQLCGTGKQNVQVIDGSGRVFTLAALSVLVFAQPSGSAMTLAPLLLLSMPLLLGLVTFMTGRRLEPFPGKDDVWRLPRRLPRRSQMQDSPHGALPLRHS